MRCIYCKRCRFRVTLFTCCKICLLFHGFLWQLFLYFVHCIVSFASCEEVEEVHAVYLLQAVQVSCNFVYLL